MRKLLNRYVLLSAITVAVFLFGNCRSIKRELPTQPVTHERWDALLKKHVGADGLVDYQGFIRDSSALNDYLKLLESTHPSSDSWSRREQMAYWINAYNAYTVQLIVRNYPIESIKDIKRGIAFVNSIWDVKFIHIQGFTYDLNNIEHNILRPVFKDARIHAAINCASMSCPKLLPEAFTEEKLEGQLERVMRDFINDPKRNQVQQDKAEVSEIFKWFKGDFERDAGSVRNYLNRYAENRIDKNVNLSYINYDWSLNARK